MARPTNAVKASESPGICRGHTQKSVDCLKHQNHCFFSKNAEEFDVHQDAMGFELSNIGLYRWINEYE